MIQQGIMVNWFVEEARIRGGYNNTHRRGLRR
jgi:hypothetical protein